MNPSLTLSQGYFFCWTSCEIFQHIVQNVHLSSYIVKQLAIFSQDGLVMFSHKFLTVAGNNWGWKWDEIIVINNPEASWSFSRHLVTHHHDGHWWSASSQLRPYFVLMLRPRGGQSSLFRANYSAANIITSLLASPSSPSPSLAFGGTSYFFYKFSHQMAPLVLVTNLASR